MEIARDGQPSPEHSEAKVPFEASTIQYQDLLDTGQGHTYAITEQDMDAALTLVQLANPQAPPARSIVIELLPASGEPNNAAPQNSNRDELPRTNGSGRNAPPQASNSDGLHCANGSEGNATTQEDINAAHTLLQIGRDSITAYQDHLKRHNDNLSEAREALFQHAAEHPLVPKPFEPKPKRQKRPLTKREQFYKKELDAAMGLVKLSGQRLTETRAALTLMTIKEESKKVLEREAQRQEEIAAAAEEGLKEDNAADQFFALKRFREQYPNKLRASTGVSTGDVTNVLDGSEDVEGG